MKRRFLSIAAVFILTAALTACGGDNKKPESTTEVNKTPETQTTAEQKSTTEAVSTSEESTTVSVPVSESNVSLSGLEQYLLDAGVLSGTRTETAAEMIGAVSGFKYTDAGAEIYEFDENSEDYKKMVETNTITLEDFGIALSPAAINGKFALIFSNEEEADQAIIDAFNSYGK